MTIEIKIIDNKEPISFFSKLLHYYRYIITLIVFVYRNFMGTQIFSSKSFIHKLCDFTLFNTQADAYYMKNGFICYALKDLEVINELFKNHRSDPNSIFKGNNVLNRFTELINLMFPESMIQPNDCMLTCDEKFTKIYHEFLTKHFGADAISNKTKIINRNIKKYFSNLDGQELDIYEIVNRYVCDNFIQIFFGSTLNQDFTDDLVKLGCCREINDYIFNNRMNVIVSETIYKNDNIKMERIIKNFRIIVNKILEENREIFDKEFLAMSQQQAMISILLFVGQETTHTLIMAIIYSLSKCRDLRKKINNNNLDTIVNAIFNVSLADSTPVHGTARILKNNIMITNTRTGKKEYYGANCVIGPLPAQLAKMDLKKNIESYEHYVPFGIEHHRCPGEDFVLQQGKLLIKYLLLNYDIETNVNKIKFIQLMTQRISTKFLTSFKKIK